ncbi:MAG: M23 family metallopeptidase, partial [Treponemataceae bacterium]|nr:M23 family metallopeptidase [Treponemataceae bacterium]
VAYVFANDKIFGNYVIVRHANDMTSVYAHLAEVAVRQGQEVSTGTKIGTVGMTGATTGPHLHFEVRQNGKPTNPLKH